MDKTCNEDEIVPVTAKEMIDTGISFDRIMVAIEQEGKNFYYRNSSVDVQETKKDDFVEFKFTITEIVKDDLNKEPTIVTKVYVVYDRHEISLFRKIKKEPQNVYAALVFLNNGDDIKPVYEYYKGDINIGVIHLLTLIIQEFMNYKNIHTVKEMEKYVMKYEEQQRRLNSNVLSPDILDALYKSIKNENNIE